MAFYKSYPLSGNPARALEIVRNYFMYNGFELTELTSTSFKARRPSDKLNMQQQHNPLMTVSQVSVETAGNMLTIEAGTGAGWKFAAFLIAIVLVIFGGILVAALVESHGPPRKPFPFPWQVMFAPLIVAAVIGAVVSTVHKAARGLLDVAAANAAKVAEFEARGRR